MREEERILNGAIDQLDDVDNLWMPRNLRHKQLITLSGDDVNTLLMISRSLADRAGRYFFQVDKYTNCIDAMDQRRKILVVLNSEILEEANMQSTYDLSLPILNAGLSLAARREENYSWAYSLAGSALDNLPSGWTTPRGESVLGYGGDEDTATGVMDHGMSTGSESQGDVFEPLKNELREVQLFCEDDLGPERDGNFLPYREGHHKSLDATMKEFIKHEDYEKACLLRDRMIEIKEQMDNEFDDPYYSYVGWRLLCEFTPADRFRVEKKNPELGEQLSMWDTLEDHEVLDLSLESDRRTFHVHPSVLNEVLGLIHDEKYVFRYGRDHFYGLETHDFHFMKVD